VNTMAFIIGIPQHKRRKPSGGYTTVKAHTRRVKGVLRPPRTGKSPREKGITIVMWRGILDNVEGLPKGWDYEVIDLDTQEVEEDEANQRALKQKPTKNTVRIVVKGGCVWEVENLPPGMTYKVDDDDT